MWASIAGNVLFKLLEMFLGRYAKQQEIRAQFYEFVKGAQKQGLLPVEIHDSYEEQGQKNRDELARIGEKP